MSRNVVQIFADNPITTISATDLFYLESGGFDAAISGLSLNALFSSSALPSGNIFVGSVANIATARALSGDGTLTNLGALTISAIGGKSISLANSFTTSGNFAVTQTYTGATNVTFPTTGTLATTAQIPTGAALTKIDDTNVTLTLGGSPATALVNAASLTLGWTGTLSGTRGGTGVNNGANTATYAGNLNFANAFTTSGNFAVTQTYTGATNVTFPTSGTLATTAQTITNIDQNTSSATLAANSRYATDNGASLVTYTIPSGAAVGDTYIIVGGSAGGWIVAQPASVQCHLGSSATTSGTGGSLASSNQYDCLTLTCVATNVFSAYSAQGNITIV